MTFASFNGFQIINQFAGLPNMPHSSPSFMKTVIQHIQHFLKSIPHLPMVQKGGRRDQRCNKQILTWSCGWVGENRRFARQNIVLGSLTAGITRLIWNHLRSNQITFIGLVNGKHYYRQPRIITVITKGWDTTGWNKFGREYWGTYGRKDCHRASIRILNVSTDEAFTITSGSLFQYGTNTQTLNACWWRRVLHRCWWIL